MGQNVRDFCVFPIFEIVILLEFLTWLCLYFSNWFLIFLTPCTSISNIPIFFIVCNVQQVLDARLPGYTPCVWLLHHLGVVISVTDFTQASYSSRGLQDFIGNAGAVDLGQKLSSLIDSPEFHDVLFDCHTFAVAATQALYASDYLRFLEEHEVVDNVLNSLSDYYPVLLDKVALFDSTFRSISSQQDHHAAKLLACYPWGDLSDSLRLVPKESCFMQDGCGIVPLHWKCPLPSA